MKIRKKALNGIGMIRLFELSEELGRCALSDAVGKMEDWFDVPRSWVRSLLPLVERCEYERRWEGGRGGGGW